MFDVTGLNAMVLFRRGLSLLGKSYDGGEKQQDKQRLRKSGSAVHIWGAPRIGRLEALSYIQIRRYT